jgi:hypothetical protein
LCPPEGPLRQIVACADRFCSWYAEFFADEADAAVLELLAAATQQGPEAFLTVAPSSFATVDKLVADFYGFYCEHAEGVTVPGHISCPVLRVQQYMQLRKEIGALLTPDVSELWQFIYEGRPVAPPCRRNGYVSDDIASWVSWWSLDEVHVLSRGLPQEFGGSVFAGEVLNAVHTALDVARREKCGLVVTAF